MVKTPLIVEFKGFSKSGKTATIISLIKYLKSKKYTVSSIKHIHIDNFSIDQPGKNTFEMSKVGADPVVSLSSNETSFIIKRKMDLKEIVKNISLLLGERSNDVIFCEGFYDGNYPLILCLKNNEDFYNLLKIFKSRSNCVEILESITCLSGVLVSKWIQEKRIDSLRVLIRDSVDSFLKETGINLKPELSEQLKNIPFRDLKNKPSEFQDLFL